MCMRDPDVNTDWVDYRPAGCACPRLPAAEAQPSAHRGRSTVFNKVKGALLRIASAIPVRAWTWLGPILARTRPLGWFAGWSFGAAPSEKSLLYRARLFLWSVYKYRRLEAPFPIDWLDGLRVLIHPGNDLSRCVYVAGTFEPNEFTFLAQILRPSMCFVDVGANEGMYTVFAAPRVGPTGKVLALEPSSREFRRLTANLELNRLTNVRALQLAASDGPGSGMLRVAGFGHEGLNTLGEFVGAIEESAIERVKLTPLDDLVEAEGLGHIDALKIDAEARHGPAGGRRFRGGRIQLGTIAGVARAAVRGIAAPVFFIHAANDYSVAHGKAPAAEMARLGKPHRLTIYPPSGPTADEGHNFVHLSVATWESDVFAFLNEHTSR